MSTVISTVDELNLEHAHRLDQGQRIGVALMAIFSVFVVVIVVLQFRHSIISVAQWKNVGTYVDPEAAAANALEASKKTDTDADGLTDYDELNIYHTSPYIKDTDSDNLLDGEEVRRGTDPLCPQGKICAAASALTTKEAAVENIATAPVDIQALRAELVKSGVPADKLAALSDAELLQLYNETQAELGGTTTGATPAIDSTQINLTPTQKRDLLISAGVPAAELGKLTDAEVVSLFAEVVKKGMASDAANGE